MQRSIPPPSSGRSIVCNSACCNPRATLSTCPRVNQRGFGRRPAAVLRVNNAAMSLSLFRVPNGQQKGQSSWPCPFVYSPASALGSLSSVALSSAPALATLTRQSSDARKLRQQTNKLNGLFHEPTILISRTFLDEAMGSASGKAPVKQWVSLKLCHGLVPW